MNKKGFAVLKAIMENFNSQFIDQVISARDSNVQNDYYENIVELSQQNNINFIDRTEDIELNSRYYFAVGWRWLVKVAMDRLIIFHDSLLPRYRGFSPLVSCLINCEDKIGVTALFAEKEFDRGKIISQESIPVDYPIKIRKAIEKIIPLYQKIAIQLCNKIVNDKEITAIPQDETNATYSLWRDENDYWIDWSKSAHFIKQFIDAVGYPYKGALTKIEREKIRIFDTEEVKDVRIEIRDMGKVIFIKDNYPIVVCGEGLLKIKEMIYEDSKENALPLKRFRVRFGF